MDPLPASDMDLSLVSDMEMEAVNLVTIDILMHLDEIFHCKVCNDLLLQAKVLDCGHRFCSYCLDLWKSQSFQCPTCFTQIKTVITLPEIDAKIESVIQSLPEKFHNAYFVSKAKRSAKVEVRSENMSDRLELGRRLPQSRPTTALVCTSGTNRQDEKRSAKVEVRSENMSDRLELGRRLPQSRPTTALACTSGTNRQDEKRSAKVEVRSENMSDWELGRRLPQSRPTTALACISGTNRLDETCSSLAMHNMTPSIRNKAYCLPDINFNGGEVPKSGRNRPELRQKGVKVIARISTAGEGSQGCSLWRRESESLRNAATARVDLKTAELKLFCIYENCLQNFEERQKGGGDLQKCDNSPAEEQRKAIKEQHRLEIENLLQEAEGVVELDEFVKRWSSEIKKTLAEGEDQSEGEFHVGLETGLLGRGLLEDIKKLKWRSDEAVAECRARSSYSNVLNFQTFLKK